MVSTRSSRVMLSVPAAFASNGTLSSSKTQLCGGRPVVDATDDWVWSLEAVPSPSCVDPAPENPGKMCAEDPTSVVIEGTGKPQCASSWMQDCKFSMRDLTQLDFDVSMLNCGGTWAAPLWMTPDYWAGGGSSGEIDMSENCPAESLWSNFAGGGKQKRWNGANPNGFQGHTTMWKVPNKDGVMSVYVKTCTEEEAAAAGGSCLRKGTAYLTDIYAQNGCRDGNCMYTMVSDIWNGWAGDEGFYSCAYGEPKLGNKCKFSVTNIRIRGVPFTGKCTHLLEWPVPAGALASISLRSSPMCFDLTENAAQNGSPVQVWSCDQQRPDAAQRWLYRDGQIIHRRKNGEEFCLNVPGNKQVNGHALNLWKCNGKPQQQFVHKEGTIKTRGGSKCVDLRVEDERTLQLWDCVPGASSQQWDVAEVLAPSHTAIAITSYGSGACLDLTGNKGRDGAKLQAWPCDPLVANSAQQWHFRDGQIIHSTSAGKEFCLDVPDNDLVNGKRLQVWSCNDAPGQVFQYQGGMIKTADGSKCLDLNAENGRVVQLWDCNSVQLNQLWLITEVSTAVFV